jgi:MFS family permease
MTNDQQAPPPGLRQQSPGHRGNGRGSGPSGRHRRAPQRRITYGEVFAVREFRWLWVAQVLSYAGDQFAQVAIAILVFHRTGSSFLTALVYALTYLPPIAGGPLLSGFADLFPRRRVMVVCDLLRVGTVGLMAVGGMPFAALCVLLFFTVLLGAPFSSARSALLPDVLTPEQLPVGSAIANITHQASQILGFVAGAAVVAMLNPYRTLGIDAATFGISALIAATALKARPAPHRDPAKKTSVWSVSAEGVRLVFGDPVLRTLLLFGWLAGFYIIPEGLAAPYAHSLRGTTFTVGLLMAAMPLGTVAGVVLLNRFVSPDTRVRMMGWLAMGACAPLIGCAWNPPLWVVLVLLGIAGMGGAFQMAAVPAFVQQLDPSTRGSAFGVAQSGLYAVQGLGIAIGGAVAETIGAPMSVSIAGLLGLCAATSLALTWTHLRGKVIAASAGLLLALVDERLGDRGLALLREDQPRDQVHQRPQPVEDREHAEEQPDEVDVHAEVRGEPGAHAGDHPSLTTANQPLPRIAVRFAHASIMPAFRRGVTLGFAR